MSPNVCICCGERFLERAHGYSSNPNVCAACVELEKGFLKATEVDVVDCLPAASKMHDDSAKRKSGKKEFYSQIVAEEPWFVAHTKPRREKKLLQDCQRQGVPATLPCYDSAHKYRGKTVVFRKPLFPGYLFLRLGPGQKDPVRQNDHVANLLEVFDQETFRNQLEDILQALDSVLGVRLASAIGKGMRVKIKHGPLRGMEGWVEERYGMTTVLLRLDFIGQAAAVNLQADELELT